MITDYAGLTGNRNLFVLATAPGDESLCCGNLIAAACDLGRLVFVAVATDGSTLAAEDAASPQARAFVHDDRCRRTAQILGVRDEWLLMLGLYDGTVPSAGPKFDALVRAVDMIMWRRDCTAIVAPAADSPSADALACHAVAAAVAAETGFPLLGYRMPGAGGGGRVLPAVSDRRAKALAVHGITQSHLERYA